jgi:hypothetical protein
MSGNNTDAWVHDSGSGCTCLHACLFSHAHIHVFFRVLQGPNPNKFTRRTHTTTTTHTNSQQHKQQHKQHNQQQHKQHNNHTAKQQNKQQHTQFTQTTNNKWTTTPTHIPTHLDNRCVSVQLCTSIGHVGKTRSTTQFGHHRCPDGCSSWCCVVFVVVVLRCVGVVVCVCCLVLRVGRVVFVVPNLTAPIPLRELQPNRVRVLHSTHLYWWWGNQRASLIVTWYVIGNFPLAHHQTIFRNKYSAPSTIHLGVVDLVSKLRLSVYVYCTRIISANPEGVELAIATPRRLRH